MLLVGLLKASISESNGQCWTTLSVSETSQQFRMLCSIVLDEWGIEDQRCCI